MLMCVVCPRLERGDLSTVGDGSVRDNLGKEGFLSVPNLLDLKINKKK